MPATCYRTPYAPSQSKRITPPAAILDLLKIET
jgi:hypothetical protein